jgi:CHAD domain-containing protein
LAPLISLQGFEENRKRIGSTARRLGRIRGMDTLKQTSPPCPGAPTLAVVVVEMASLGG